MCFDQYDYRAEIDKLVTLTLQSAQAEDGSVDHEKLSDKANEILETHRWLVDDDLDKQIRNNIQVLKNSLSSNEFYWKLGGNVGRFWDEGIQTMAYHAMMADIMFAFRPIHAF